MSGTSPSGLPVKDQSASSSRTTPQPAMLPSASSDSRIHGAGTLAALFGLFVAHAINNAFLNPTGASAGDSVDGWTLMRLAGMGATIGQPALMAIGAVLAPVRGAMLIAVTLAATVLLAYAMLVGISRNTNTNGVVSGFYSSQIAMMVFEYLFFACLLAIVVRLRRWRLVPEAQRARIAGRQFGLYGLLSTVTLAGVVFGVGHWVLPMVAWPDTWDGRTATVADGARTALVSTSFCLPVIFCLPATLVPGVRGGYVAWAIGSIVAAPTFLLGLLVWLEGPPVTGKDLPVLCSVALGGYGSVIVSLLVVRLCGFRLVRAGEE